MVQRPLDRIEVGRHTEIGRGMGLRNGTEEGHRRYILTIAPKG